MRLLLDTHVFLWFLEDSKKLRSPVRTAIASSDVVYVSVASAWEIVIKVALGKLRFPVTVEEAIRKSDFSALPILLSHTEAVGSLPMLHGDPFDRLLVAQAREEGLRFVTNDERLIGYPVDILRA